MNQNQIVKIAKVCHQANKMWCELNDDFSQKDWDDAKDWQRISAVNGVTYRVENENATDDAQHNSWMKEKVDDGWVYGEIKDEVTKTHPCIVPFNELPEFQRKKDTLFCAIVDALSGKKENNTDDMVTAFLDFRFGGTFIQQEAEREWNNFKEKYPTYKLMKSREVTAKN